MTVSYTHLDVYKRQAEQSTDGVINDESGLLLNIKLNDDATKTSAIKVGINNLIKTQNTYKDVDLSLIHI